MYLIYFLTSTKVFAGSCKTDDLNCAGIQIFETECHFKIKASTQQTVKIERKNQNSSGGILQYIFEKEETQQFQLTRSWKTKDLFYPNIKWISFGRKVQKMKIIIQPRID